MEAFMPNNSSAPAVTTSASLTATSVTPNAAASPVTPPAPAPAAEGSLIGRLVAILTPIFAVLAGGIAGWVAKKIPGVHLDASQIVAFMVAAVTAVLTAAFKYLSGWQQHEQNVADRKSPAIKQAPATKRARG